MAGSTAIYEVESLQFVGHMVHDICAIGSGLVPIKSILLGDGMS